MKGRQELVDWGKEEILIVKTGETIQSLALRTGDSEHWILTSMQVGVDAVIIVDVRDGSRLADYEEVGGVIITVSHTMVTEHQAWSERTAAWLPEAVERGCAAAGDSS